MGFVADMILLLLVGMLFVRVEELENIVTELREPFSVSSPDLHQNS